MTESSYENALAESGSGAPLSDEEMRSVAASYTAIIERPTLLAFRPFFFCPVGIIGSGKSTVTRQIAERFGLTRVSGDEIRELLRSKGFSLVRTLDIALVTIRTLLDEGCGIAIDSDCADPHVRETIGRLGEEFGYPIMFVRVTAPESVLLERNQRRDDERAAVHGEGWVEGFHRRKPLHESGNIADIDFLYTLDTSRDDVPAQIDAAVNAMESELRETKKLE